MLLGTTSLVSVGNDDSFIAYYSAMIDMFKEALPEGVIYYVQAIPAVAADVVRAKPGLDNARIQQINCRLAQLAMEKGCYFIDLQEALTGPDGNQIAEYAARDGIHSNAQGYPAWVDYLRTHTPEGREAEAGSAPAAGEKAGTEDAAAPEPEAAVLTGPEPKAGSESSPVPEPEAAEAVPPAAGRS